MRVVVADDDRVTTTVVAGALTKWGIEAVVANDGVSAWNLLCGQPPASLAIVDWEMPGLDGIELCRRVRSQPALSAMYLILLTGRSSRPDLVTGLEAGADDYMLKPIHPDELRARVNVGIRVTALQANLSERVAELQVARDDLTRLVSTDALTGLYSRRWWFELAHTELARARRYGRPLSVLEIDLDHFKRVNDSFGHSSGDQLLQQFADMLRVTCRTTDVIGRLGGEEFAILVPETPLVAAQTLAGRINDACRSLVVRSLSGLISCSCSIGITETEPGDDDIETVLRRADLALYEAKSCGRDGCKSYRQVQHPDRTQLVFELA
jgi:two-component system cell cycle response regulator